MVASRTVWSLRSTVPRCIPTRSWWATGRQRADGRSVCGRSLSRCSWSSQSPHCATSRNRSMSGSGSLAIRLEWAPAVFVAKALRIRRRRVGDGPVRDRRGRLAVQPSSVERAGVLGRLHRPRGGDRLELQGALRSSPAARRPRLNHRRFIPLRSLGNCGRLLPSASSWCSPRSPETAGTGLRPRQGGQR